MDRYARLSRFKPIGSTGLELLRAKKVAIIGVGALGTTQAEILVRSGIGEVTLIDRDYVDLTNLQRQTLFTEEDCLNQMPKAIAAKRRLEAVNKDVKIQAVISDLNSDNAETLLAGHDCILDGTDNFETRLVINDVAVKHQIPWIYGAATGSYGLSYTFLPGKTACFSCAYKYMPMGGETCETVGIIGPAAELTASVQCTEAFKILTDNHESLRNGMFYFDLWSNDFSTISLEGMRDPECPTCGLRQFPYLEKESGTKMAVLCGRNTVQIRPAKASIFDYRKVAKQLNESGLEVTTNDFLTQLHVAAHRLVLFRDGRALVHGTNNLDEAKTIYHRYIGG